MKQPAVQSQQLISTIGPKDSLGAVYQISNIGYLPLLAVHPASGIWNPVSAAYPISNIGCSPGIFSLILPIFAALL